MGAPLPRSPCAAEGLTALLAVVLHLGVLGLGLVVSDERLLVARSSREDAAGTWLDFEQALEPGAGAARDPGEAPREPAPSGPAAKTARVATPRAAEAVTPSAPEIPPEAPSPSPEPAAPAAEAAAEAPAAPAPPVSGEPTPETPSGAPAAPPPVAGAGEPGHDEYGGPPAGGAVVAPGLAGAPVWSLPGVLAPAPDAPAAPAPTRAPGARPVDPKIASKALTSTMLSHDKELGLQMPAAGVVATTLSDAVRSSEAPGDARASFEVQIGGDGQVRSVRVLSSSTGNAGTWERVAKKAAAALAQRALTVGEVGRDGVTVKVKITSKLVYPAGSKERGEVAPVCAEDMILNAADALGQLGTSDGKQPRLIEMKDGRFCIPVGIALKGDLSNIGATNEKVVSATYDVALPNTPKLQAGEVLPVDTRAPWLKNLPAKGPRMPLPKKWEKKKKKKP